MHKTLVQYTSCVFIALALVACGGGGGGSSGGGASSSGGSGSTPTPPADPPVEIVDPDYDELSDRTAAGVGGMAYVVLQAQTPTSSDAVSITYNSGAIAGGLLNGTDLDNAEYTNPAGGEFSRIVRISGNNVFGAVGLDVQTGDLPTTGTTTYNQGWVGMVATVETGTYVLEGNAEFTAHWIDGDVDGRFYNLDGTFNNANVGNQGSITLTGATIANDNFSGGQVAGTGIFAPLDGSSSTSGTSGTFFGPAADELGGLLSIDDSDEDIRVLGAFQAD